MCRDEYPKRLLDRLLYLHDSASEHRVGNLVSISDGRWAAFGIGSKMPGSLMFIIAANNGNVTLSVRVSRYEHWSSKLTIVTTVNLSKSRIHRLLSLREQE